MSSPYTGFVFRCNKCPAAKAVKAPLGYPQWDDSLLKAFDIDRYAKSKGTTYGEGNKKREEAEKLLRSLSRGLSYEESW